MMRSFKKKSDLGNGSHYVTGANTDGAPQGNPDTAEKSGESTDSDDDFDEDDLTLMVLQFKLILARWEVFLVLPNNNNLSLLLKY